MIRIERKKRKSPEIGIAPLVDCVFLLLIFFLLTSTFHRRHGLKIELPSSTSATPQEEKFIVIALSREGTVSLGRERVEMTQLSSALREEIRKRGRRPILLLADRLVPLELVTKVIDSARSAGLTTVSIATRRQESGEE